MELLEGGRASERDPREVEVAAIGRPLIEAFRRQPKDLALVPVMPDERPLRGVAAFLDWGMAGALSRALLDTPPGWQELLVPGDESVGVERIVLLQVRPEGPSWAGELGERMFGVAIALDARRIAFAVPAIVGGVDGATACLEAWNASRDSLLGDRESSGATVSTVVCAQPALVGRLARVLAGPIRPARG